MNRQKRIEYVQNEVLNLTKSLCNGTRISSDKVVMCIFYLGLNLPYSFIEEHLNITQNYIRKIKSTHKDIVSMLQRETSHLYEINGIN